MVETATFIAYFTIFFNFLLACLGKIMDFFVTHIFGVVILSLFVLYFFTTILERLINK